MARVRRSKEIALPLTVSLDEPRAEEVRHTVLQASEASHPAWRRAWTRIANAWPGAVLDDLEVDPAGVFLDENDRFSGIVNAYVILSFDAKGLRVESAEALPGSFEGHFEKNVAKIDGVQFDTSVLGVPPH